MPVEQFSTQGREVKERRESEPGSRKYRYIRAYSNLPAHGGGDGAPTQESGGAQHGGEEGEEGGRSGGGGGEAEEAAHGEPRQAHPQGQAGSGKFTLFFI